MEEHPFFLLKSQRILDLFHINSSSPSYSREMCVYVRSTFVTSWTRKSDCLSFPSAGTMWKNYPEIRQYDLYSFANDELTGLQSQIALSVNEHQFSRIRCFSDDI